MSGVCRNDTLIEDSDSCLCAWGQPRRVAVWADYEAVVESMREATQDIILPIFLAPGGGFIAIVSKVK